MILYLEQKLVTYLLAISPVVEDNGKRKPEATRDVLPEEFDNLLSCDLREGHYFHPLSEVVHGD